MNLAPQPAQWPLGHPAPVPAPNRPLDDRLGLEGGDTVLVVDDEAAVREVTCAILEDAGFRVLCAASAEQALLLATEHRGPLDLLVADLVLPGESGAALASRLCRLRPGLRVLLMSGYGPRVVSQRPDFPFLAKPFGAGELLASVRGLLYLDPP